MILKNKRVAILGAGPVGLTLARLLQQQGADLRVYERDRDPQARIWGGTLDLHQGTGQEALRKAGLLDAYYAAALPMGIVFVNEQGKTLSTREVLPQNRHDNPEINRNDLRRLLLRSLDDGTVVWDRKCTGLEPAAGRWQLQFENGNRAEADLVIVASGGRSRARSYVTDTAVEETGTFILQGDVPEPQAGCPGFYRLCGGKRLMAAHGGTLLVANPANGSALTYGVIFRKPEEWDVIGAPRFDDRDRAAEFLSGRMAGWDERFAELLRATSLFVGLPTRKLPLDRPWKAERPLPITLVGDAAHLMPPFAGQGVNTGLRDALLLATNLTEGGFDSLSAAIADYEGQMRRYAADAQLDSSRNELQMRHPDFTFQQLLA